MTTTTDLLRRAADELNSEAASIMQREFSERGWTHFVYRDRHAEKRNLAASLLALVDQMERAEPVACVVANGYYTDGSPKPGQHLRWVGDNEANDLPSGTFLYTHPAPEVQRDAEPAPTKRDPMREAETEAAIYWRAFVRSVAVRGCSLSCSTNERGRTTWECTVGRTTVPRRSPESALWGALQLEFDGEVPEDFGLQKSTLRKLVFSGEDSDASMQEPKP